MRIGIDIDSVLCDTVPSILKYLGKKYGVEMAKYQITQWDFPIKSIGKHFGEVIREAFQVPGFLESLPPVVGARTGMFTLIEESFARPDMSISLVTSRSEKHALKTRWWVDKYFHPDLPIWHTQDGGKNGKFDILIDDYHENIRQFLANGGRIGLLYSQPWNETVLPEMGVYRVNGWLEVLNELYTLF